MTLSGVKRAEEQPIATGPKQVPVAALLDGRREVILLHDGKEYRLRLTSNDKLILTK